MHMQVIQFTRIRIRGTCMRRDIYKRRNILEGVIDEPGIIIVLNNLRDMDVCGY